MVQRREGEKESSYKTAQLTDIRTFVCDNCSTKQKLPEHLWHKVRYKGEIEVKTVCPACLEWVRTHPKRAFIL